MCLRNSECINICFYFFSRMRIKLKTSIWRLPSSTHIQIIRNSSTLLNAWRWTYSFYTLSNIVDCFIYAISIHTEHFASERDEAHTLEYCVEHIAHKIVSVTTWDMASYILSGITARVNVFVCVFDTFLPLKYLNIWRLVWEHVFVCVCESKLPDSFSSRAIHHPKWNVIV